ncbi:Neurogenic locus notch -like protein 2 [Trichinella pseudospiralis]|uniref:Neurogenic locus notch-like protein 2 n=1 Tax=Trichinella pseudospiralis TaxID=6337 RepID=A0A0V1E811_TRIPS|nr:Neurogenic locus notch -like protein 2 [Trichinella pseudospiralis]
MFIMIAYCRYFKRKNGILSALVAIDVHLNINRMEQNFSNFLEKFQTVLLKSNPAWNLIDIKFENFSNPILSKFNNSVIMSHMTSLLSKEKLTNDDSQEQSFETFNYIHSNGFPGRYLPNTDHSWEIINPDEQDGQVQLKILALNLAYDQHTKSCSDYIEIYIHNTLHSRLCQIPTNPMQRTIISMFNDVKIRFVSKDHQDYENFGFLIEWQFNQVPCVPNPCANGGVCSRDKFGFVSCVCPSGYNGTFCDVATNCNTPVLTDIEGSIVTPNLYLGYQSGSSCNWLIRAPFNHIIHVTTLSFFLNDPKICSDYIRINDYSPFADDLGTHSKRFCGSDISSKFISKYDTIEIQFAAESNDQFPGAAFKYKIGYSGSLCELSACDFHPTCKNNGICLVNDAGLAACKCKANFTGYDCSSVRCNDIFDEETGSLSSPSFPVDGSSTFQCQYRFIAKDRKGFLFNFKNVKLRSTYFDNVYIFSSWNTIDNDMIYSFNGIPDDFEISVRASKALILLSGSADPMENNYGFELQYSSTFACDDLHSGCASKETCISFNESIAHVSGEDNTNADYKKENDFCNPNPCKNNGKCISLANDFKCQCPPYYFAGKRCEIINCQNIRLDSKFGFIVPPGYPNEYVPNLNCSWIFTLNETTMEYTFQSLMFNVEGPQNRCSNDYLEFDSAEDHSRKMRACGVLESAALQLEYPNPLIVRFVTDEDVEEDGFFINYRHQMKGKCNETLKSKYGDIFLPDKSILEQFQGNVCTWTFESSIGGFVDLYIERFKSNDCQKNYLQILDVDINGKNEIICETSYKRIKSPQNKFVINVFMENKSGVTFKANYRMYVESKDNCDMLSCPENSKCTRLNDRLFCHCNEGYTYVRGRCNPLRCAASPCLNGGTCIENLRKNIHCKCSQYYGGQFCQIDLLCNDHTCSFGNGVCIHVDGKPHCACKPEFTGESCQFKILDERCGGVILDFPAVFTSQSTELDNTFCEWKIQNGKLNQQLTIIFDEIQLQYSHGCVNESIEIFTLWGKLLYRICLIQPKRQLYINYSSIRISVKMKAASNSVVLARIFTGKIFTCKMLIIKLRVSVDNLSTRAAVVCSNQSYCFNKELDLCSEMQCNGGHCVSTNNTYAACKCPAGYAGSYCEEKIKTCEAMPCKNGGSCLPRRNGYLCKCTKQFYGVNCEKRMCSHLIVDTPSGVIKSPHFPSNYPDNSECSWKIVTNPDSLIWLRFLLLDIEGIPGQCHFDVVKIYNGENSASELLSSDCGYKTETTPPIKLDIVKNIVTVNFVTDSSVNSRGFMLLWNITSSLCRNVKCPLHSVCELGVNGTPICTCDFGYYGEKCEEVDHCLYVTCANGGTCKTHGNSFHCICSSGITGLLCDEDIDECIENPCKNKGICVNTFGSFKCQCAVGNYGRFCENVISCQTLISYENLKLRHISHTDYAWIIAPEKYNRYAQLNPLLVDLINGEKIQIFDGNYWNISHDVQLIAEFDKDVEALFPVRAYQNWLSVFFWTTGTFLPEKKLIFDAFLTSSESPPGCQDRDCKYPILTSFEICKVKRLGLPWLKLFHWELRRDSECATTIFFGQKKLVNITFSKLSFSGHTNSNGYIAVYDGDQNSNILIGKFTEYTQIPFYVLASSKMITVKYVRGSIYFGKSLSFEMIIESHTKKMSKWNSSYFYEEKSFQVKELTVWKQPGLYEQNIDIYDISKFKEIASASGVLVSPGYPRRYRPQQYYTTRFVAPPGNVFSFAFHSLDLEYPWRNVYCFDAVVFIDPINNKTLQQYILKICGNLTADAKQNFISSGNEIIVAFYSDDESEYSGFELHFQTYANRCLNHSCPPHSSCVSYPESYHCRCDKGYAGFDCQEAIDQCSSSPCVLGHGMCANKPDGSFVCRCKEGYTGKHCEHDLICPLNYCQHKGRCERESGKPRCICKGPFSGPRCEQASCGETTVSYFYIFESMNHPEPYPPSLDCKWTITTKNVGRYIYEIYISYVDLECGWDYVKIQLSNDEIITLCQAKKKTFYSDNSTLNMWFHSDSSKSGKGFYITAEAIINPCVKQPCGNNFICQVTGPNSRECICEPGYTGKECDEIIDICADVDCKNGGSCYADKLNFTCVCRKGYRGKFCEIQSNPCIPNPCGHFGICKQVDIAKHTCSCILPASGNSCRECIEYKIIISHSGVIKSPEYPFSYPNEMQCDWLLYSILDAGSGIFLKFNDLQIPALDSSCSNGIVIYDSSNRQIKRFCGYEIPKSLFVNETKIRIAIETSQLQHDVRRFALSYTANFDFCSKFPCKNDGICENSIVLKEARSRSCQCRSKAYHGFSCETRRYFKCGQLLESKPSLSGIVATPDFPLPYNSSYCKWPIQVPKDHIIEITFTTLETYRNCSKCCTGADQVLLEDQNGHIISKFCGHALPPIFTVQSDHVVVVFNAKQTSNTGIGFHLLYRAVQNVCFNDKYCLTNQSCVIDRYGKPFCICPFGYEGRYCTEKIDLCKRENILCNGRGICENYATSWRCRCRKGYSGRLCEIDDWCNEFKCENGGTCLHSKSGPICLCTNETTGQYCEKAKCGGIIRRPLIGTITSPKNFSTNYYFKGTDCEWEFIAPEGTCVHLKFYWIDLSCTSYYAAFGMCTPENIKIYNSKNKSLVPLKRLCFEPTTLEVVSLKNNLILSYHSEKDDDFEHYDKDNCFEGACAEQFLCVDQLDDKYKCICKPGFTGKNCDIVFDACASLPSGFCGEGRCVNVGDSFYCECSPGWTGEVCMDEINYCDSSPCIYGTCHSLKNAYYCSCIETYEYYSYGPQCEFVACKSITLSNDHGILQSPFYPEPSPRDINCNWKFYAEKNKMIIIDIEVADLNAAYCATDYLAIFDQAEISEINEDQPQELICDRLTTKRIEVHSDEFSLLFASGKLNDTISKFYGRYMTVDPSLCTPNPCQNNGNCSIEADGTIICKCPINYYGQLCEKKATVICDAETKEINGTFSVSPDPLYTTCSWTIYNTPVGNKAATEIEIHELYIPNDDCNENFLEIYTKKDYFTEFVLLRKLCSVSNELSSKIMSVDGYAVKLILRSIDVERKFAFSYNFDVCTAKNIICKDTKYCVNTHYGTASYSCLCKPKLTDPTCFSPCQNLKLPGSVGAFNSPGFPHLYPSNVHCSWRIKNRSNSTAIMLTMKYMNIRDNSPYCDDEYIEIHSVSRNHSNLMQKICGKMLDVKFFTMAEEMIIYFHTDVYFGGNGFVATYGIVNNPCIYLMCKNGGFCYIHKPSLQPVCQCRFGYFGLLCEKFRNCPDGYCLNGGVCVSEYKKPYRCSCPKGLQGKRCEIAVCGGIYYTGATLSTPNILSLKLEKLECNYFLETESSAISVQFEKLFFGWQTECKDSYVEIHEGWDQTNSSIIGRYCNNEEMPALIGTQSNNRLFLVVRAIITSDKAANYTFKVREDFKCHYTICPNSDCSQRQNEILCICPPYMTGQLCDIERCGYSVVNESQGIIKSFGSYSYYLGRVHCFYNIKTQPESVMALTNEEELWTEENSLIFFDGKNELYYKMENLQTFLSSTNEISIQFSAVFRSSVIPAFEVTFYELPTQTYHFEQFGELSTFDPVFAPFRRFFRRYTITVPGFSGILLQILYFNVIDCTKNHVDIYVKEKFVERLCDVPITDEEVSIASDSVTFVANFTRYTDEFLGFSLNYSAFVDFCIQNKVKCPSPEVCKNSKDGAVCVCPAGVAGTNCRLNCDNLILHNSSAIITSPRYPDLYMNNLSCLWKIAPNQKGKVVKAILTIDHIEGTMPECNQDFVAVSYLNSRQQEIEIGKYCGKNYTIQLTSATNNLIVKFKSDERITFSGFVLEYTLVRRGCQSFICLNGGTCSDSIFQIFCTCPPGYIGMFCEIDVFCAKHLCQHGATCLMGKCKCAEGFTGQFCENFVNSEQNIFQFPTTIVSPFYPHKYPNDINITWNLISVESGLLLRFKHISLEYSTSCDQNDFVQVSDLNRTIGIFCGSMLPPAIYTTNKYLKIIFHSDSSISMEGFEAFVANSKDPCEMFDCSGHGDCIAENGYVSCKCHKNYSGENCEINNACRDVLCMNSGTCILRKGASICNCRWPFTGATCADVLCGHYFKHIFNGKISFLSLVNSNVSNVDCTWTVEEPENSTISIHINNFQMKYPNEDCNSNFLEIVDRKSTKSTVIAKYCDSKNVTSLLATKTNLLTVRFVSKHAMDDSFAIDFTTDYQGKNICNFYCQNYGKCKIQNQKPICDCPDGFSGVHCEKDLWCSSNPCLNGGTCKHNENNTTYQCICLKNFNGNNCENVICGGTLKLWKRFTSPLYPNSYPNLSRCIWTYNDTKRNILLSFTNFQLELTDDCSNDYVAIERCSVVSGCSSILKSRYCGDKRFKILIQLHAFQRNWEWLKITFISDSTDSFRGFSAKLLPSDMKILNSSVAE